MEFILDYGFSKLKLHKIWLDVHADNFSTIKLYQKFGFVEEGVFRHQVYCNDVFGDEIRMAKFQN
jgi:RimJ/RimL family protein N-acetyltransferase